MEIQKVKTPREKWQELVLQCKESKKTAKVWCDENSVTYDSFIYWRSRLKDAFQTKTDTLLASFVEITENSQERSGIEIRCHNLSLTLSKDFDSLTLLRCLQVLEKI